MKVKSTPPLLTDQERKAMVEAERLDIGSFTAYRPTRKCDFVVSIDARLLVALIDTADYGGRIYELMSILRPGSSGQIELYPKDIDNFYIPLINKDAQNQIADLVQQSFTLKAESERLLEPAKRAVEMAIETDEQTALDYINEQTGEKSCSHKN